MRPAAPGLADRAAQHQHVNDGAVAHVHVIPMVQTRAEDHHGAAVGLLRIGGKLARHRHDGLAGDPGDPLRPGRRAGDVLSI